MEVNTMKINSLTGFKFFDAPIDGQGGQSDPTPPIPPQNNGNGQVDDKSGKGQGGKLYTDEDVNRIINEKFAKWQSQLEAKQAQSAKFAQMSDLEKAKAQQEAAEKQAEEYKAQLEHLEMQRTSRELLTNASMPIDNDVIDLVTTREADSTKANIDALIRYGKKIEEQVKLEYLKGEPQNRGGNTTKVSENLGAQLAKAHNKQFSQKNPYFN